VYEDLVRAGVANVLCDGLHPNEAGHEIIHRLVRGVVMDRVEAIWSRSITRPVAPASESEARRA
jgi:hypothetical protein